MSAPFAGRMYPTPPGIGFPGRWEPPEPGPADETEPEQDQVLTEYETADGPAVEHPA